VRDDEKRGSSLKFLIADPGEADFTRALAEPARWMDNAAAMPF